MSKQKLINRAIELLEEEHPNCDQNTCLIQREIAEQYPVHIIDIFSSSGAASEGFCKLAKRIVTRRESGRDADLICKNIPHSECSCNAVVWDMYGEFCVDDVVQCSSCGNAFKWNPKKGDK